MGMKYIRDYYKVPAKRGGRVLYMDKPGTIVSAWKQYLRIRLDGEKRSGIYHPTYEITYLTDASVIEQLQNQVAERDALLVQHGEDRARLDQRQSVLATLVRQWQGDAERLTAERDELQCNYDALAKLSKLDYYQTKTEAWQQIAQDARADNDLLSTLLAQANETVAAAVLSIKDLRKNWQPVQDPLSFGNGNTLSVTYSPGGKFTDQRGFIVYVSGADTMIPIDGNLALCAQQVDGVTDAVS